MAYLVFTKRIYCLAVFIALSTICFAQKLPKFGEISLEELKMTSYEKDTSASAVVLFEEMDSRYEYDSQSLFKIVNRYFVRIKILTNEGLSLADQSVSTIIGRTRQDNEVLSGLSGYTYNLAEGDKIDRIRLSKEHIFEEKTSESITRTKFAFQSVKPGSVIEYRYELSSPYYWDLKNYFFQRSIPVKYSRYYLKIPEYFQFSKESKGMEPVSLNSTQENQIFFIDGSQISFSANIYDFTAVDLPGLKDESFVWSIRDYLTRVTFELHTINFPGSIPRIYSSTWNAVDEKLLTNSNFGKQLDHKFFKDELPALFTADMTDTDKVRAIYSMVKTKVKWNEQNSFGINNPRDALRKGLGTSAEINAILISALREAGFDAYPVAMSRRNIGRIPLTHPTIDNFNYFIVAVDVDNNPIYLDASSKYGDLNVMSTSALSDFARSIREKNLSSWLNLTNISKSTATTSVLAKFNDQGVLSGTVKEFLGGQIGYSIRNTYSQSTNEQTFIDNHATAQKVEISSLSIQNVEDPGKTVNMEYDFTKKEIVAEGNYIYFNPLIMPLFDENPFKEDQRNLPVEFPYPFDHRYSISIEIPDGYQVEELPKSTRIMLGDDNRAAYQYFITEDKDNHRISLSVRLTINDIVYLQDDYSLLRDFFLHLVTSNNEQAVLKKIE